jgi:hypothetical protein
LGWAVGVEKEGEGSRATFNARAESVAEKPMFRDAFKRSARVCLLRPKQTSAHETERPPRGGLSLRLIVRSAGALGQASASPKSKAGLVAHRARGDLQRFVGDVEGKYFFLSLRGDIQHGIDPTLWCSSINAILLVDFGH